MLDKNNQKAPHVLIVGYYGMGNAGDNHCLFKTIALIKEHIPKKNIQILYHPNHENLPKNTVGINRWKWKEMHQAIKTCDHIILGGGSLLQNKSSKKSLWYYLTLLLVAKWQKKNILLLGQGFENIRGRFTKMILKRILNKTQMITVRDVPSQTLLTQLGITQPIYTISDLSFYNPKVQNIPVSEDPIILAISLKEQSQLNTIIQGVQTTCELHPYQTMFIALDEKEDTHPYQVLHKKHPITYWKLNQHLQLYPIPQSLPTLLISMRYHSCVWASIHQIPFLALSDDPKLKHLSKSLDQPFLSLSKPITKQDLLQAITNIESDYPKYKKKLQNAAMTQIQMAQKYPELIQAYFHENN